jgi:hypothetical protein
MEAKLPVVDSTEFSEPCYLAGMERLIGAVQELSLARDLATIQRIVRAAARELTGADGATFVSRQRLLLLRRRERHFPIVEGQALSDGSVHQRLGDAQPQAGGY